MSRRPSKKRKPPTVQGGRPPRDVRPAAPLEVVDVLGAALGPMSDLFRELSRTDDGLETHCALVVDWQDPISRRFFERWGRGETPPQATVVTFAAPFDDMMHAGAVDYRMSHHVEAPLHPGELRAIVLTLGTLTVCRLERDETPVGWNPVHVSDSYEAKGVLKTAPVAAPKDGGREGLSASPASTDLPPGPHRLFRFVETLVSDAVASFARDPAKLRGWAVFVFDGWDEAARGAHNEFAIASGGKVPPGLEQGEVTVIGAPFDAMIAIAAPHYRLSRVEPGPLPEGQVRVVLLAQGRIVMRLVDAATFRVIQA